MLEPGSGSGGSGGSGVFAFDNSVAGSVQGSIGTVMTDLSSALADLEGFVTWVKGQWKGDEMEMYAAIQEGFKKNAKTVEQILAGVKSALTSVDSSVEKMRQSVRDSMKEHG